MDQEQKFNQLLVRNEDWIISKILIATKNYQHSEYISLVNHSWRHTVKSFSKILSESYEKCKHKSTHTILEEVKTDNFRNYAICEVKKCLQRNIKPHIYLSFLKIIREVYEELFSEVNILTGQKIAFYQLMEKCFDCIEVAFIQAWTESTAEAKVGTSEMVNGEFPKSLFNAVPIALLMVNPFHKITQYNRSARKLLPFLFEEKKDKIDGSIKLGNQDSMNARIDEFRISQHKESNFESTLQTYAGSFHTLIGLRKLEHTNDILVSFIDLTDWKNHETRLQKSVKKAEESNRLKTIFLANMSHEIRTPMNAIVGFSELLSMTNPSQKDRDEFLCLIKKSSTDLLHIIEDVIDIAKIESKQLKIIHKRTQPAEIVRDLARIYAEQLERLQNGNVKINIRIPDSESKIALRTDPKRLKQVLSNLIGNAIKFTEKGTIEVGYKLAENKLIYFYVKDTGIGIPQNMQPKIFDQFVQVENTYQKNKNGTGLGLAISKNLVNLMGGNIWVSSTPSKGSNFYFYLPYIKAEKPKRRLRQQISNTVQSQSLATKTILIAEDEESSYRYLEECLQTTGARLLRAHTGSEAIRLVESNDSIDLILMDIKLPEINGIDATKYISHIKPHIPIIAQTAFAMESDRQACLEAGCCDYISKPINISNLMRIIKKHSGQKQARYIYKNTSV